MNLAFLPDLAVTFLLVFARVGALIMLLPGVGERFVPMRLRLTFALFLTLAFLPSVSSGLPASPSNQEGVALITLLISEIFIGLVIGLSVRMIVTTLQTAGLIISQQIGLSFAMTVDPTAGTQNAAIGNLLTLLGMTLVFVMDLHHLVFAAMYHSYTLLPPGGMPEANDAMTLAITAMSRSFKLAVQMSAPFIVFTVLFNLGLGILSRLMPQLQVFFLAMPATILIGMVILMVILHVLMGVYTDHLTSYLTEFIRR
jgi:flagellar biosynthetic protein FliR